MKCWDADIGIVGSGIAVITVLTAQAVWTSSLASIASPRSGRAEAVSISRSTDSTFPVKLIDPDGWVTRLKGPPQRIVSVAIATDEMLLGLVAPNRLVAVSTFADRPSMSNIAVLAKKVPKRVRGDAEQILALQPDLVLATEFLAVEVVESLRGCGVPVHRIRRHESLLDIVHDYSILGRALQMNAPVLGRPERYGERLVNLAAGEPRTGIKPTILLLSAGGFTAGSDTLWHDVVERAGGTNHAATLGIRGYGTLSVELALAQPPDWIVVAQEPGGSQVNAGWLEADPNWRYVPTVAKRRFILIPSPLLSTVSQYAVDGCETLKEKLRSVSNH